LPPYEHRETYVIGGIVAAEVGVPIRTLGKLRQHPDVAKVMDKGKATNRKGEP
jgi:hypothetical protein